MTVTLLSDFLADWPGDLAAARSVCVESLRRDTGREAGEDPLERRWYESLADGRPDYTVYVDPAYVGTLWACWNIYSRKYLASLATLRDDGTLTDVRLIADLGCGLGLTTAELKRMWPDATVIGTNVPGPQFDAAVARGRREGFEVTPGLDRRSGIVDLVFASEYLEHFVMPVDHLASLISVAQPRYLVLASAFGSPAIGHFPTYDVGGRMLAGRAVGRAVGSLLRKHGYERVETGFWNNRPTVWRRDDRHSIAGFRRLIDEVATAERPTLGLGGA